MENHPLVDFNRTDLKEALGNIPTRFHGFARQYAEEVAAKINSQSANDPGLLGNVRDTTVHAALSGLSCIRWYLLFTPERTDAAEQAWRDDGVVGLCIFMRELHQAERILLVSGYGHVKSAEANIRLAALHEKGLFTLVVVTHGAASSQVKAWAKEVGIPCLHFPLDSERDLASALSGQYYAFLDKLAPRAVCVFTNDSLAMRLAEYAARKSVPLISAPDPAKTAPPPQVPVAPERAQATNGVLAENERRPLKPFRFAALMKGSSPES